MGENPPNCGPGREALVLSFLKKKPKQDSIRVRELVGSEDSGGIGVIAKSRDWNSSHSTGKSLFLLVSH